MVTITTFQPATDTTYIPCVSMLDFWAPHGALELVVYAHSLDFGKKAYGNLVEIAALGLDPVHMGVMVVMNLMIGLVTPPFGLVMFVVCDLLKVTITDFTRELWPFLMALVAILLTITYVPEVVLFLPKLAMR